MGSSTTRLDEHVVELLHLLLGAAHGSQTLLGELAGALILAVLQQLHAATLVGSESGDFTDQVTDELDTLSTDLLGTDGGLVTGSRWSSIVVHCVEGKRGV